jgi:hypothetical protein
MAVVINEFEVVPGAAPQQQRSSGSGSEAEGDKKSPPSEHELKHLFEQQMSRDERVWAH